MSEKPIFSVKIKEYIVICNSVVIIRLVSIPIMVMNV